MRVGEGGGEKYFIWGDDGEIFLLLKGILYSIINWFLLAIIIICLEYHRSSYSNVS